MSHSKEIKRVLVTGGAGYVGSALIPQLLEEGYQVRVLDLYIFGEVFTPLKKNPNLEEIKGDLRNLNLVQKAVKDCDAVIHLACISNDPSFELNPELGKSINFDAFEPLVKASKEAGVQRFIYASSSSVYGVSEQPHVTEVHPLIPLTDYSKFKALCEPILLKYASENFAPCIIRPATVCGYAPRLRLDLTVNILTNHAVNNRKITIFGGGQMRPNIHIHDMTALYRLLLKLPKEKIAGKTYNAGYENYTVKQIAQMVKKVVEKEMPELAPIELVTTPTDDNRSYHISSEKIKKEIGFAPTHTLEDAMRDLLTAFKAGKIPNSMTDPCYFNIKTMQQRELITK